MKVVSIDSKTGEEVVTEINDPRPDFFAFINDVTLTDSQLRSMIDKMDVSADVKAMLYSFSKVTIRAGNVILQIGRKIVDILFAILRAFPNITFGVVFGLIVGALVASIPVLGAVLGSLATTIAVAFGFVVGAKADLLSGEMGQRIDAILAQFSPLSA